MAHILLTRVSHHRDVRTEWYLAKYPEYDLNIPEAQRTIQPTISEYSGDIRRNPPNIRGIFGGVALRTNEITLPNGFAIWNNRTLSNLVNIPEHPEYSEEYSGIFGEPTSYEHPDGGTPV